MVSAKIPCFDVLWQKYKTSGSSQITVIIPLYNYRHYIEETLESVRMQTLSNLDLVVVDDCSADKGSEVVLKWLEVASSRFNRATLLRFHRNSGLALSRNTAILMATTEYVFPLDSDNLLYPACLEKLLRSLESSSAAFSFSLIEKFGPDLDSKDLKLMHLQEWNPESFRAGNYIDAMCLLRKTAWLSVGGYSTHMPHPGWEDYDLWIKLARMHAAGLQVFQILARYRAHNNSMLRKFTNTKKAQYELMAYLRESYPEFFN